MALHCRILLKAPLLIAALLTAALTVAPLPAPSARAAEPEPDQLPALVPPERAVIEAVPSEQIAATARHYFRSNEWRQDLLAPHLRGLGGVYLGVGSDQNYTMAALARSELLLLVDLDPRLQLVHKIYGALISASPDADTLINRFDQAAEAESLALLRRHLRGDPDAGRAAKHFGRLRGDWHAYLRRVKRGVLPGQVPLNWLARPELYGHVRQLHRAGRVIVRTGDLCGTAALRGLGRAAGQLSLTVRVVYFSNAEQFFAYTPDFIRNMQSLPVDDRSVLVRTDRSRKLPRAPGGRWHYVVHSFRDFLQRIETGAYPRSFALIADLVAAGPPALSDSGVSTIDGQVPRTMLKLVRERRKLQAEKRRRKAAGIH